MTNSQETNGIDTSALTEALETVRAAGVRSGPKAARVRWVGGLKLRSYVRNHSFMIDEPTHLTGEDEAPNALEYVLGALGACYATGFVLNATLRGIELYNLEVTMDSTQDNIFTFLQLEEAGHSGFDNITAKLYVQADADEAVLREIWETTLQTSPVGNSLTRTVAIKPELSVMG